MSFLRCQFPNYPTQKSDKWNQGKTAFLQRMTDYYQIKCRTIQTASTAREQTYKKDSAWLTPFSQQHQKEKNFFFFFILISSSSPKQTKTKPIIHHRAHTQHHSQNNNASDQRKLPHPKIFNGPSKGPKFNNPLKK